MPSPTAPSVAIAHDYLTQRGGAERVVLAMLRAFPGATIYTTLYDPEGTFPEFRDAHIVTSPLNRVPLFRHSHRAALPLLAPASQRLTVPADVVIMSTSGWAHGFAATGRRLVYCHAPARWLYQTEAYLGGPAYRSPKGLLVSALKPWLLRWDRRAAAAADRYLTNSRVVRDRVRTAYGIEADVLPAPHSVATDAERSPVPGVAEWLATAPTGRYHLLVSRLLPYKNVDKAVEAFRGTEESLLVVGSGPEHGALRATLPPNVRIVSDLTDAQLRWAYAGAHALVAPSLEDYGLTPLEAAAFGVPSLTLRAGGYLDTVAEGVSGAHFDAATPEAIRRTVLAHRHHAWDRAAIRAHAELFSEEHFRERLRREVAQLRGSG